MVRAGNITQLLGRLRRAPVCGRAPAFLQIKERTLREICHDNRITHIRLNHRYSDYESALAARGDRGTLRREIHFADVLSERTGAIAARARASPLSSSPSYGTIPVLS
jgi:hypothetical protein